MEKSSVGTGFRMRWVLLSPSVRHEKWGQTRLHPWAARLCGEVKADAILGWKERCRVRLGASAHRPRGSRFGLPRYAGL